MRRLGRGEVDDYIVGTLQIGGRKMMIALVYNPPSNSRRQRQEYEESNRVMVDTLAKVARKAHVGRAKVLVMGNFNRKEINWGTRDVEG